MPQDQFPALQDVISDVKASDTLDKALASIAHHFGRAGFNPVSCGLVTAEPSGLFRIRGIWTATPSDVEAGMAISPNFTELSASIAEELLMGTPVSFSVEETDLGLLTALMRKMHTQSVLIVPMGAGSVVALLVISSSTRDAFSEMDTVLFEGLARAVELNLIEKPHG